MGFNEILALRIRQILAAQAGIQEKKMFGGVGFMFNGNMACGVHKEYLIVRVGSANYKPAISRPHTRPFDMTGRLMAGWVMVEPEGYASESDLRMWINMGLAFAQTLPAKG
jgi:hypothetical protein